jgi:hypothetical protein
VLDFCEFVVLFVGFLVICVDRCGFVGFAVVEVGLLGFGFFSFFVFLLQTLLGLCLIRTPSPH